MEAAFGGVTPLAVGAYGEVSASVCELLAVATEYGATRLWRRLGCGSEAEARSLVGAALSARCGVAFVREQAHLLECRLHRAMPCARDAAAVRERPAAEGDPLPVSRPFRRPRVPGCR